MMSSALCFVLLAAICWFGMSWSTRGNDNFRPRLQQNWLRNLSSQRKSLLKFQDLLKVSSILVCSFPLSPQAVVGLDTLNKQSEVCMSKCVFEETKPPPLGSTSDRILIQRSRAEIIIDCKKKCQVVQNIDRVMRS